MAAERNLILTICTGNVCRSPMAARLLQHALKAESPPLDQLEVLSAGVAAGFGDPASENSVAALKKVGLDLSDHQSQPLSRHLMQRAFAVFGMTHSHLDILRECFDALPPRVHLFREFTADGPEEIPDPFGMSYDAYVACLDAMAEAVPSVVAYLRREYAEDPGRAAD